MVNKVPTLGLVKCVLESQPAHQGSSTISGKRLNHYILHFPHPQSAESEQYLCLIGIGPADRLTGDDFQ